MRGKRMTHSPSALSLNIKPFVLRYPRPFEDSLCFCRSKWWHKVQAMYMANPPQRCAENAWQWTDPWQRVSDHLLLSISSSLEAQNRSRIILKGHMCLCKQRESAGQRLIACWQLIVDMQENHCFGHFLLWGYALYRLWEGNLELFRMRWQERCSANFVKNTIGSCSARKDAYTTIMRNDDSRECMPLQGRREECNNHFAV